MAYRAVVDAAYRQYAIDGSDTRAETLERETATPAVSHADVEDPERYLVVLADRLNSAENEREGLAVAGRAVDRAWWLPRWLARDQYGDLADLR